MAKGCLFVSIRDKIKKSPRVRVNACSIILGVVGYLSITFYENSGMLLSGMDIIVSTRIFQYSSAGYVNFNMGADTE